MMFNKYLFFATKFILLALFVIFFLDDPDLTADVTSSNSLRDDYNVAYRGRKRNLKIAGVNVLNIGFTHAFFDNFFEKLLNLISAMQSRTCSKDDVL